MREENKIIILKMAYKFKPSSVEELKQRYFEISQIIYPTILNNPD